MTLLEKNEMIAKFLGGNLSLHPELNGVRIWHGIDFLENRLQLESTLKFHSSYEWIYKAIEKIVEKGYDFNCIAIPDKQYIAYLGTTWAINKTVLSTLFDVVVEFVKVHKNLNGN